MKLFQNESKNLLFLNKILNSTDRSKIKNFYFEYLTNYSNLIQEIKNSINILIKKYSENKFTEKEIKLLKNNFENIEQFSELIGLKINFKIEEKIKLFEDAKEEILNLIEIKKWLENQNFENKIKINQIQENEKLFEVEKNYFIRKQFKIEKNY